MKVAVLQQFLNSLAPALAAAGDSRASAELARAVEHLSPFHLLEVADFAAFLERAQAYRANGAVTVPGPGEQQVDTLVKAIDRLSSALQKSPDAIADRQTEVSNAILVLAERAGLKGKLAPDPKWAADQAAKARIAPQVKAIRELAGRIGSPDAFNDATLRADIDQLANGLDRDSLKTVAAEFGIKATAAAKSDKVLIDVLAKVSGHQPAKGKKSTPAVDPEVVEGHSRRLAALVERSADPDAVTEAEVESELGALKSLKKGMLFEVVSRAGIEGVRPGDSATELLQRTRNRLTAAKRARERAEV